MLASVTIHFVGKSTKNIISNEDFQEEISSGRQNTTLHLGIVITRWQITDLLAYKKKKWCVLLLRSPETQLCPQLAFNVTGPNRTAHSTCFFSWLMELFPITMLPLSLGFGWRPIPPLGCLWSKMKHPHSAGWRPHPDVGNGGLPVEQHPPEHQHSVPGRSLLGAGGDADPPPPHPSRAWTPRRAQSRQLGSGSGTTQAGPLSLNEPLTPSLQNKTGCVRASGCCFFPS